MIGNTKRGDNRPARRYKEIQGDRTSVASEDLPIK